jgi:type II secretory pathway pseudopilin PulG
MSTGRAKRGFTIVEALMAVALTGVTIAGVLGGIGALSKNQSKMLEHEKMQRLAVDHGDSGFHHPKRRFQGSQRR